jgi:hypothetical protein
MDLTMQKVVRKADGTYTVRTYGVENHAWVVRREVPAGARDVAQATLYGDVIDERETLVGDDQ